MLKSILKMSAVSVAVVALSTTAIAGGMGYKPQTPSQSNSNVTYQGGSNASFVHQAPTNLNFQGIKAIGGDGGSNLGFQHVGAGSSASSGGSAPCGHGCKKGMPSGGGSVSSSANASGTLNQTAGSGGVASVNAPVVQTIKMAPVTVNQGVNNTNGTVQSNSSH
jgi:hypothetical protein